MLTIVYSFNKRGHEGGYWAREIAEASDNSIRFVPFNHEGYLEVGRYIRAQLLDNLYYERNSGLLRMYADLQAVLARNGGAALIVDNCPPYHPEFLKELRIYKVLRVADGPISAYDRDFAYLHAYDHVLYHSPAYSADLGMAEKLRYCGARNIDLWPLAFFDAMHDPTQTEASIVSHARDIDIVFIGTMHVGKMPLLAAVKKAFGRRCRMHGLTSLKRNAYFNLNYGFPGWIRPVPGNGYVPLYQRAKVGFNVHNRGEFTIGNYRLFELPANGVMQISDGGRYLDEYFKVGDEIVRYENADELIDRIKYYLANDSERKRIALNGYRRAMKDHRIKARLRQAGELVRRGMARVGQK
jgi:spore maturation protein CgeB